MKSKNPSRLYRWRYIKPHSAAGQRIIDEANRRVGVMNIAERFGLAYDGLINEYPSANLWVMLDETEIRLVMEDGFRPVMWPTLLTTRVFSRVPVDKVRDIQWRYQFRKEAA